MEQAIARAGPVWFCAIVARSRLLIPLAGPKQLRSAGSVSVTAVAQNGSAQFITLNSIDTRTPMTLHDVLDVVDVLMTLYLSLCAMAARG